MGSATYAIRIYPHKENGRYTLELPEIFSAYRLWVDGRMVRESGNPQPGEYQEKVANSSVTFEGGKEIDILIQVSNYSHYYSGMVYPPAFGSEEAVGRMLSIRLIVKSVQCFLAVLLTMSFGLLFFLGGRDKDVYKRQLQRRHVLQLFSTHIDFREFQVMQFK